MDLSLPVPDDVKEALRDAWAKHMVIYWRGQKIDDDQLMAVSGIFGPPHEAAARKYHLNVGEKVDDEFMISRHPSVSIISNIGANGKPVMDTADWAVTKWCGTPTTRM
jgi:alpha-ketoglutarate-dependent taurine dioxygenase